MSLRLRVNMTLNSFITKAGGEMGRAQVVQAEAAVSHRHTHEPVLLKPTTDVGSQIIVNGRARQHDAMEYYRRKRGILLY